MRGEAICRVIVFITLCSFGIGCINHAPSPPPPILISWLHNTSTLC